MKKSIIFLALLTLPFSETAVAQVADPQITGALHLYNICLSHHVPENVRTREDHINSARCAARLSSAYWSIHKRHCKNPQVLVPWFLEFWDGRGGIGLYGIEILAAVEAVLNPPDIPAPPKGFVLVVPGCD